MAPSTLENRRRKRDQSIDYFLSRVFKKAEFRYPQREVIEASLQGHDVFLQAATSFGKSLCFQLPAMIEHGITIVISPLIALMNDQVSYLALLGVKARCFHGKISNPERQMIIEDLARGHPTIEILYVTPEKCTTNHFQKLLDTVYAQNEFARIAIDEAHCISEWGHDFRPAYEELHFLKGRFPRVPIMCLTATATKRVRDDVIKTLKIDEKAIKLFEMNSERPNLHFEVRYTTDNLDRLDSFIIWLKSIYGKKLAIEGSHSETDQAEDKYDGICGIIYSLLRDDCETIASRLQGVGIGAKPFHAGLDEATKERYHTAWVAGKRGYDVIVATTAFGMGINKDNVRFVCHWQIPKSFEGFYQEAGRAGRDGKASLCIVYYSREDRERGLLRIAREKKGMQQQERLKSYQAIVNYCESTSSCRHALIAKYFGGTEAPLCEYACDWHKSPRELKQRKETGLATEDWCMTQKETGGFGQDDYDLV